MKPSLTLLLLGAAAGAMGGNHGEEQAKGEEIEALLKSANANIKLIDAAQRKEEVASMLLLRGGTSQVRDEEDNEGKAYVDSLSQLLKDYADDLPPLPPRDYIAHGTLTPDEAGDFPLLDQVQELSTKFQPRRQPRLQDYKDVERLINFYVGISTCPPPSQVANHWDWDGKPNGDCVNFPRIRNPHPLGARFVRLAFHDAAGVMDGFVLPNSGANNGLQVTVRLLDFLYSSVKLSSSQSSMFHVFSLADLYSWAGIAAIRVLAEFQSTTSSHPRKHVPQVPIRFGRVTHDPTKNSDPREDFPSGGPDATVSNTEAYFRRKFGFDAKETAIVMGAHTLGSADIKTTGFAGSWTNTRDQLNEEFFENMIVPDCGSSRCSSTSGWQQVQVGRNFQWRHSCNSRKNNCKGLMLNIDMGLYRDIEPFLCKSTRSGCSFGEVTGFPSNSHCRWGRDPVLASCFDKRNHLKITANTVEECAEDRDGWIDKFVVLYDELMRNVPRGVTLRTISQEEEESGIAEEIALVAEETIPQATE